jgi:hypothetical protein
MSNATILRMLLRAKPVVVRFAKTVAADPMFVQLVVSAGKSIFSKDDVTEEPIGTTEDGDIVMAQFTTCEACGGRGRIPVEHVPEPVDAN